MQDCLESVFRGPSLVAGLRVASQRRSRGVLWCVGMSTDLMYGPWLCVVACATQGRKQSQLRWGYRIAIGCFAKASLEDQPANGDDARMGLSVNQGCLLEWCCKQPIAALQTRKHLVLLPPMQQVRRAKTPVRRTLRSDCDPVTHATQQTICGCRVRGHAGGAVRRPRVRGRRAHVGALLGAGLGRLLQPRRVPAAGRGRRQPSHPRRREGPAGLRGPCAAAAPCRCACICFCTY